MIIPFIVFCFFFVCFCFLFFFFSLFSFRFVDRARASSRDDRTGDTSNATRAEREERRSIAPRNKSMNTNARTRDTRGDASCMALRGYAKTKTRTKRTGGEGGNEASIVNEEQRRDKKKEKKKKDKRERVNRSIAPTIQRRDDARIHRYSYTCTYISIYIHTRCLQIGGTKFTGGARRKKVKSARRTCVQSRFEGTVESRTKLSRVAFSLA